MKRKSIKKRRKSMSTMETTLRMHVTSFYALKPPPQKPSATPPGVIQGWHFASIFIGVHVNIISGMKNEIYSGGLNGIIKLIVFINILTTC